VFKEAFLPPEELDKLKSEQKALVDFLVLLLLLFHLGKQFTDSRW